MGTLTADCPRLDEHCPHKLATSCVLWTHRCCACRDERPHSPRYSVYIDGVGYVQRGTRWQSYCSSCKEFWSNRVAASYPRISFEQTQIPRIPDQTEFLERWFEFHQGHRVVTDPNGEEHRVSVIGEPLRDVSPGFLPRTLDELRRGVPNDARRAANRFSRQALPSANIPSYEPTPTIDEALDLLMEESSDEDADLREQIQGHGEVPAHRQATQPLRPQDLPMDESSDEDADLREQIQGHGEVPAHRQATQPSRIDQPLMGRAHERLARIFGTREEIEQDDYVSPIATMYGRAAQRYRQAEARRATGETVALPLDSVPVSEQREIEEQILWGVLEDSRPSGHTAEAERPFRDALNEAIIEASRPQGPAESSRDSNSQPLSEAADASELNNYIASLNLGNISDLQGYLEALDQANTSDVDVNGLFTRTHPERENTALPDLLELGSTNPLDLLSARPAAIPSTRVAQSGSITSTSATPAVSNPSELRTALERLNDQLARIRAATDAVEGVASLRRRGRLHMPELNMDRQNRPDPLEDDEMKRTLVCQVCYCQLADIALLPCGHMVLCQWCADTIVPVMHSHLPAVKARCPVCRKTVKQRYKIHM